MTVIDDGSECWETEGQKVDFPNIELGGDYMIPACRDEISTHPAEVDITLRLHVEIKFRPGNAGQFSTWYLIRFAYIFF